MSERLGVYVGECGHPRPILPTGRIGACKCDRPTTGRPAYFDQLAATVEELGRSRHLLGQVIALADDAPGLTDEQLRDRLTALADRSPVELGSAAPSDHRFHPSSRRPVGSRSTPMV